MKVFYSKMDPRDVEFVESCKLNLRKFTADKVFEDIYTRRERIKKKWEDQKKSISN